MLKERQRQTERLEAGERLLNVCQTINLLSLGNITSLRPNLFYRTENVNVQMRSVGFHLMYGRWKHDLYSMCVYVKQELQYSTVVQYVCICETLTGCVCESDEDEGGRR